MFLKTLYDMLAGFEHIKLPPLPERKMVFQFALNTEEDIVDAF
jgi:hypothetical protein